MSIGIYYSSLNLYWTGYETWVKFKNNQITALTALTALTTLTQGGFTYQYYPNVNLCVFTKSADYTIYGVTLGSFMTSTDVQSFTISFLYTFTSQSALYYGWFNSGVSTAVATLGAASSWTTSSFSKGSNLLNSNNEDLFTVSWSANYLSFPEGSYMVLIFSSNFILMDEYCRSYSGFLQGTSSNSNLVCKRYNTNQIIISGYALLSASASLSITLYMQIANIPITNYTETVQITVYSSVGNTIISANTDPYVFTLAQLGSAVLGLSGTMTQSYYPGNAFPLYIVFQLTSHSLYSNTGDYIQIDFGNWVIDVATTGSQIFKYQVSGTNYWVPSLATLVSGNIYKLPVYSNYSMLSGYQITLRVDTLAPTSYYGAMSPSTKWNTFKIYAYKSGTLVEQSITRIWT